MSHDPSASPATPTPPIDSRDYAYEGRFGVGVLIGRGLLVLGGLLLIWATLQPWAIGETAAGDPRAYRPTEGLGEGVWMIFGAIIVLFLAALRHFVETTNRILQVVPYAIALIVMAMWLNAWRYVVTYIAQWQFGGGAGAQTIGPFLAPAGALAIFAGALVLERARPVEVRRATRSLVVELGLNRRGVATVMIAVVFGLAGGVLGLGLPVMAWGFQGVLPGLILGILGFLLGVGLGNRLARRLVGSGSPAASQVRR